MLQTSPRLFTSHILASSPTLLYEEFPSPVREWPYQSKVTTNQTMVVLNVLGLNCGTSIDGQSLLPPLRGNTRQLLHLALQPLDFS